MVHVSIPRHNLLLDLRVLMYSSLLIIHYFIQCTLRRKYAFFPLFLLQKCREAKKSFRLLLTVLNASV